MAGLSTGRGGSLFVASSLLSARQPGRSIMLSGMRPDETLLWRDERDGKECVMISCCSGAELQIRRGARVLLRELYPDKATLYERAAQLRGGSELPPLR
jgi:hypothetical protein